MEFRIPKTPKSLTRFHFHETSLFRTTPQTLLINQAILNNHRTRLIKPDQQFALQKSFDRVLQSYNGPLGALEGGALAKLYFKAYRPFLNKSVLHKHFGNLSHIQELETFARCRAQLDPESSKLLHMLSQNQSTDFGILRGDYFVSLGILRGYSRLLSHADKALFKGHHKLNTNFSEPLSILNAEQCEKSLEKYLHTVSASRTYTKNYLVVNSPKVSEAFANMASKFGTRIILMTEENFSTPSSTVETLLWDFDSLRRRGDSQRCEQIQQELSSLKFVALKNKSELMSFIQTITSRGINSAESTETGTMPFHERLKDMEMSILGVPEL